MGETIYIIILKKTGKPTVREIPSHPDMRYGWVYVDNDGVLYHSVEAIHKRQDVFIVEDISIVEEE